jgi:flagellar motility protein MotE (MotC chaperone)
LDEKKMHGKIKSSQYDVKNEYRVTEEEAVTTELSDQADNELYIRYKISQFEMPDLEEQEQKMKTLRDDIKLFRKGQKTSVPLNKLAA